MVNTVTGLLDLFIHVIGEAEDPPAEAEDTESTDQSTINEMATEVLADDEDPKPETT